MLLVLMQGGPTDCFVAGIISCSILTDRIGEGYGLRYSCGTILRSVGTVRPPSIESIFRTFKNERTNQC
jgi:hypothetical protein